VRPVYVLFKADGDEIDPVAAFTSKVKLSTWFRQPMTGGELRNPEHYILLRFRDGAPRIAPEVVNLHDVIS
jgi:hypothetical protein